MCARYDLCSLPLGGRPVLSSDCFLLLNYFIFQPLQVRSPSHPLVFLIYLLFLVTVFELLVVWPVLFFFSLLVAFCLVSDHRTAYE